MAKPDALRELQRVSGLSRSMTQSSSPNLLVSRKESRPLLGGAAQMAPQSPQKANKGSDPHFAAASGDAKPGRLAEQGTEPPSLSCRNRLPEWTPPPWGRGCQGAPTVQNPDPSGWGAGGGGVGAGAGAGPIRTVKSWPPSC